MALVPMKQTVSIKRESGELNIYGKRANVETLTKKCRALEGSHVTEDKASAEVGKTVVVSLKLLFDKLAEITYDDEITYVNELGTTYAGKPKNITVRRDFAGKAVLTEVFV